MLAASGVASGAASGAASGEEPGMMMPLAIIDPGTGEHRLDMMGSLKRAFEDATLKMELRFKEEQVCLLNIETLKYFSLCSVYVQSMFSLCSVYVQSMFSLCSV